MQFEKEHIYHIYNQGNNKRKIFFNQDNYHYFLQKIKTYITPYADIIAYCLMPNHFHLMVVVKNLELIPPSTHTMTLSHRMSLSVSANKTRTFNQSIAIMLRSYTRAINKEQNLSGSLFRAHTKAECVNKNNGITPSFINKNGITNLIFSNTEQEYPLICFNYIHKNPVKAGLVKTDVDWMFSSAKDYSEMRDDSLVNKEIVKKYLEF